MAVIGKLERQKMGGLGPTASPWNSADSGRSRSAVIDVSCRLTLNLASVMREESMGRFRRRQFLVVINALLALPSVLMAQGKVRRIGCLSLWAENPGFQRMLTDALRAGGYEVGRSLVIEWRWANGKVENLPRLAADLISRGVELIVAVLNDEILAATRATRTLPIVMWAGCAPVEIGLIASLRRPGGNVTGTTWYGPETAQKLLQILNEAKPTAKRVAVLWNPLYPGMRAYAAETDRAAAALGVRLEYFDATRGEHVTSTLRRIAASPADALLFVEDPVLNSQMREIASFASAHNLVSVGSTDGWVRSGGLLSYAANSEEITKRMVAYVDRILRGSNPADMPVEQPSRYELAINLKTATSIGLRLSPSLLARADWVIE